MPLVKGAILDAKVAKTVKLFETLKRASSRYWLDTGQFPTEDPDSNRSDLFSRPAGLTTWKGPYIDRPFTNQDLPWTVAGHIKVSLSSPLATFAGTGFQLGSASIAENAPGIEITIDGVPNEISDRLDVALDVKPSHTHGSYVWIDLDKETKSAHVFLFPGN